MESIAGSAYEWRFWEDKMNSTVVFERLREPVNENLRTYVSPDRRQLVRRREDGLYESILTHLKGFA